ncbi:hypothetical protein ACSVDA_17395 [Cytobacillus sp. Hm23]
MSKTTKLIKGLSAAVIATGLSGCSSAANEYTYETTDIGDGDTRTIPIEPSVVGCDEWDWDVDDEMYECDDDDSDYRGHYFYQNKLFKTKADIKSGKYSKSFVSTSTNAVNNNTNNSTSQSNQSQSKSSNNSVSNNSEQPTTSTQKSQSSSSSSSGFGKSSSGSYGG